MVSLRAFQKRFVRGALAPGTDTLLYDAIVTALGKPGSPMKDRPVTVRLLYGATDEQVAERMAPARHAIQASVAFPPVSAEVVVNLENHPTSFRRVFAEALEFRSRGFKPGSKTAAQAKSLFEAYISRYRGKGEWKEGIRKPLGPWPG